MKNLKAQTLGVVLAGGKSSRLGQDKSLLELAGKPLWLRAEELLSPLVNRVIISHNQPELFPKDRTVVTDAVKEQGPMGGIYSVMSQLASPYYLLLAVDAPLLKEEVLKLVSSYQPDYQVVCTEIDGRLHPLPARYSYECLPIIAACLATNRLRLREIFCELKVKLLTPADLKGVDPELESFFNLNTPAELAEIQDHLNRKLNS